LLAQSIIDLVGTEFPIEESEYSGTGMDRYEWRLALTFYGSTDEDAATLELAEMSGIELYRVDLDIDWESGRRHRDLHFSTMRSVLANRR